MANEYNKRQWSVTLNGSPFIDATNNQQFKCTFEILHDFGGHNCYADIAFYNMSADTANKLLKRSTIISFNAGYESSIDTIFTGVIINVLRERVGPTTITRVICTGDRILENQPQINESKGRDIPVTALIRACALAADYPLIMDTSQFDDLDPYPYGYMMTGDPFVILRKLAKAHDFDYILENERIVVVRKGHYRNGDVYVVSQFTGMEGIPEITDVGVDVTVRLNPKLRIGGAYRIESDLATFSFGNAYYREIPESAGKGDYQIKRLSFSGDTKGDAWSTKITGYRI